MSFECAAVVQTTAGNSTSVNVSLVADTLPPAPTLQIINPSVGCGATLTVGHDVAPATNGVQVEVLAAAADAAALTVQSVGLVGAVTDIETSLAGVASATLAPGLNRFQARATDAAGNSATTEACSVTLADISVAFDAPYDGGMLGAAAGTVNDGALTVDLCGTVSEPGATVMVSIDGATAVAATTDGAGGWCIEDVALPEQAGIALTATATFETRVGGGEGRVTVDLTPPGAIEDLAVVQVNRHTARVEWTAPADSAGYEVKIAEEALTDGNFDTTGSPLSAVPGGAGAAESLTVDSLRPGRTYHVAVRATDVVGNSATVVDSGVFSVDFIEGAVARGIADAQATLGIDVSDSKNLGIEIATGDVNRDGFADLLAGAPLTEDGDGNPSGQAALYLGGPDGIGADPHYIFTPAASEARGLFGRGVAITDWNEDGIDDVVIGAPFQNSFNGRVLVYYGDEDRFASEQASSVEPQSAADVVITGDGEGFFLFGVLGWRIQLADFDGDSRDDLILAAGYANFEGGVAIVYGGTARAAQNVLSETSVVGDAVGARISMPDIGGGSHNWAGVYSLGAIDGAGDRFEDIAVTNVQDDPNGEEYVFVYRGRTRPVGTFPEVPFRPASDLRLHASQVNDPGARDEVGLGLEGVATIDDGAGGRYVIVSEPRKDSGYVYFVPGTAVGEVDVDDAATTRIAGGAGFSRCGDALPIEAGESLGDFDMDGKPDVAIGGRHDGDMVLAVWFGGELPTGVVSFETAAYMRTVSVANRPDYVSWVGDIDGDGLDDFVWSDDEEHSLGPGMLPVLH